MQLLSNSFQNILLIQDIPPYPMIHSKPQRYLDLFRLCIELRVVLYFPCQPAKLKFSFLMVTKSVIPHPSFQKHVTFVSFPIHPILMIRLEKFWEGANQIHVLSFTSLPRSLKIHAEATVVGTGTAFSTDKCNRKEIPETNPIYKKSLGGDNQKNKIKLAFSHCIYRNQFRLQ